MKFSAIVTGLLGLVSSAAAFTNPIRRPGGADPHITWSGDGYYYLLTTTWSNVQIARSATIDGLKTATKKVVYSSTVEGRCCNVWAPEVHYLGGRWYIYFTAGNSANLDNQNLHVLQGGATPWDTYTYAGKLTSQWTIDGSVIRFASYGNYMMSSCFNGGQYQSICLQKLNDDNISLSGSVYVISTPDQSWERNGTPVNEGPEALYMGGKTMIGYSASYCWTAQYCVGLLTWNGSTNPTQKSAWTKSNGCVFGGSGNGHYGGGHNAFFQSKGGGQTWIAYHATSNSAGACDDTRYTMMQPLGTNSDGSPNFGSMVSMSQSIAEPV